MILHRFHNDADSVLSIVPLILFVCQQVCLINKQHTAKGLSDNFSGLCLRFPYILSHKVLAAYLHQLALT